MHFFFDANISWRLCYMTAAVEGESARRIVHITRHPKLKAFNTAQGGNEAPDSVWLKVLGEEDVGWVVVSGDNRILETPQERAALRKSGLRFFALDRNFQKAGVYEQAWKLMKVWPQMVTTASAARGPAFYKASLGKRLAIVRVPT